MKNTITQIPNSYIINDNLLAVLLFNDNDECIGFYMYPIVQIRDDNTHRLYHIALMPDCKYLMPIVSTIKTKSEYILKRMWVNHALDIKTICIGRKNMYLIILMDMLRIIYLVRWVIIRIHLFALLVEVMMKYMII